MNQSSESNLDMIATITITKEKGLYTGRIVERVTVRIDDGEEFEVPYGAGWGFDDNGKRYSFKCDLRGPISVISPDGHAIKLGKKGGQINLVS
jgi:hypothetical protein